MYSKLMLGTVQFGMNYGVANTTGKPSFETVKAILKEAYDGGINALDTAPEYGDSEEVIGKALKELGLLHSRYAGLLLRAFIPHQTGHR